MVRKSERNKVGSEKVEKPTSSRKPTRSSRRRKKSSSDSEPEPEKPAEEKAEEIPLPPLPPQVEETAETAESKEVKGRRGRTRRQPPSEEPKATEEPPPEEKKPEQQEWNEDSNFWGESSKQAATPEQTKMDAENSTWKIQSSNGSGGEIQKLKICRQRLTDSAESSSSPTKELASPRRKRKDKDRLREGDDAESTGSHTDPETPTSTVGDAAPLSDPPKVPTDSSAEVDSTSRQEEEIPLPKEEPANRGAESPVASTDQSPTPGEVSEEKKTLEVLEEVKKDEVEESEQSEALDEALAPAVEVEHSSTTEPETPANTEPEVVQNSKIESPINSVPQEETQPSVSPEGEDMEEGELKPAMKPMKNLKLAVSNDDAMQQIAKKLNERAARFSKEATEEAARRLAPVKTVKEDVIEEDEEEGEISRELGSTKTLELKRLSDEDVEPCNKRRECIRRPVSVCSPTTPSTPITPGDSQKDFDSELAKQQDVSTELLKNFIPDVIEPATEEEVEPILVPKDGEPDGREVITEDESGGAENAEIIEEEGELVDENSRERRKSSESRHEKLKGRARTSSREEPKKSERRVTKEPKESGRKSSKSDRKERRPSVDEPKAKKKYEKIEIKKEEKDKKSPVKHKSIDKMDKPEAPKSVENHKTVRKIAIVSDDAKNVRRSISPPTKKPSPVLFVTNLVRPFTIGQLRELLARTGTISPSGFFIDKIKSKCFVKYNDVEMAIETRHALHGVRWPVTNPRTLRVEFSTDEAMEAVKKQAEEEDNAAKRQDLAAQGIDKGWFTEKDVIKPLRKPKNLVREWDMGKDVTEIAPAQEAVKKGKEDEWGVKAKDKTKDESGRRRPISPSLDQSEPVRKIKRRDNDAPAKLLDDLFRKTKSTPCIYWLPLTAAQIAVKEEMRRQHMAEHQKRLAELRKTESVRRDKDKSRDRERERGKDRRRK